MAEFEQRGLSIEISSDEETATYEQAELFPKLRQGQFYPSAKHIRIGRAGVYHARLALSKTQPNPAEIQK